MVYVQLMIQLKLLPRPHFPKLCFMFSSTCMIQLKTQEKTQESRLVRYGVIHNNIVKNSTQLPESSLELEINNVNMLVLFMYICIIVYIFMCYSFSPCTDFFWLRGIKVVVVVVVVFAYTYKEFLSTVLKFNTLSTY